MKKQGTAIRKNGKNNNDSFEIPGK
jgi:hypothetical protein